MHFIQQTKFITRNIFENFVLIPKWCKIYKEILNKVLMMEFFLDPTLQINTLNTKLKPQILQFSEI